MSVMLVDIFLFAEKFIECSGRLAATAELLDSQKKEEKSKCDKAKRKIDDLLGERNLQKKEVSLLMTRFRESFQLSQPHYGFSILEKCFVSYSSLIAAIMYQFLIQRIF